MQLCEQQAIALVQAAPGGRQAGARGAGGPVATPPGGPAVGGGCRAVVQAAASTRPAPSNPENPTVALMLLVTKRGSFVPARTPAFAVTADDPRLHVACRPFQFRWRAPGHIAHVLVGSGLADKAFDRGAQPEEDSAEPVSEPEVDAAAVERPPSAILNGAHGLVTFGFHLGEAPAGIDHFLSTLALDDQRDLAWQPR
jgi:hypothetical protein